MIKSFGTKETERIWRGEFSRSLSRNIQRVARRKLRMLNNAQDLADLRIPPANRLEKLYGDRAGQYSIRAGQYSIRISDQWRICFQWSRGDANEVEVVDYH